MKSSDGSAFQKMKLRHELKYYISYSEYLSLKSVIKHTMKLDDNTDGGGYLVRSLYYDDIFDSALHEKNYGIKDRAKYRIRIYNYSDRVINLERKRKFTNVTNKENFRLDRGTFDKIINGDVDFMKNSANNVAQSFYIEHKTAHLRPKVIVDYQREPYVMESGNVRITFDKDLSASSWGNNLFEETIRRPILEPGYMILEVKYDEFLPASIQAYLMMIDKKPFAISKYVMCREKLIFNEWSV